jgi:exo-1,4-beta-D-glucosaminidase
MRLWVLLFATLQLAIPLAAQKIELSKGWKIQSSAKVASPGETLSTPAAETRGWIDTEVPATVVATHVKNGLYPDPFFGKNLRSLPGVTYPEGQNFSNLPMSPESPFAVPWWYRTEFVIPKTAPKTLTLHFDGLNYRANVWLNGKQIGKADDVAGAWRRFEFDISKVAVRGSKNVLAVQVFAPTEHDLAITFVDWYPQPPDKNMGLWRPVYITASGAVTVRYPLVTSKIDSQANTAALTISADLANHTDTPVRGNLIATIGTTRVSRPIDLAAGGETEVELSPEDFPQLVIQNPKLWWPAQMGTPNLYDLEVSVEVNGKLSDRKRQKIGIREITSELNGKGRLFKVNGKPILIRGGGWAVDMMVRFDPKRMEHEVRYALDMGMNTIRLEGKLEPEAFFELTDRLGMLVMAGWCCCDHWEKWENWKAEDHKIAEASQRDQIKRLRSHPSMLVWLNGSDNPPPPDVEQAYISVLKQCKWPNPYISSATAQVSKVTGETGVKMTGPYDYVAPAYWLVDDSRGGAWGFNTETSPGPAVPPIESLRKMLPKEHLWPIDDWWNFHAGGQEFKDIEIYTDALIKRYGEAGSAEEYAVKAQAMNYEGIRAMFEGYSRNKYRSTGVIQWMLNNGWPSLIWHLYDYYLLPGGGYFGAKKAMVPVHAQYSYDDNSIWLVNSQYQALKGLKIRAAVLDFGMKERFAKEVSVDAEPDSVKKVLDLPNMDDLTKTYFVVLTMSDASGKRIDSNLYWLSTSPETFDWAGHKWYYTPTKTFADFTQLNSLPKVKLTKSVRTARQADKVRTTVTLKNPSKTIAFMVRLKAEQKGQELLPVLWEDNYFSLLPGEERQVTATHDADVAGTAPLQVVAQGWNVTE